MTDLTNWLIAMAYLIVGAAIAYLATPKLMRVHRRSEHSDVIDRGKVARDQLLLVPLWLPIGFVTILILWPLSVIAAAWSQHLDKYDPAAIRRREREAAAELHRANLEAAAKLRELDHLERETDRLRAVQERREHAERNHRPEWLA